MPEQNTHHPFRGRRVAKSLAPLAAASALAFSPLSAQFDDTWNGDGSDNLWSNDNNWADDTAPTSDSARTLLFDGSFGSSSNRLDQDIASPFEFDTLTFRPVNNTDNWVGGNTLRVFGAIRNEETNGRGNLRIANDIELGADATFRNESGGDNVIFDGNIDLGSHKLTFEADGGKRGNIIDGVISGTGSLETKGGGTEMNLQLLNTNTFSGGVNVAATSRATLFTRADDALGTGETVIQGRNEFTLDSFDADPTFSNDFRIGADSTASNGAVVFNRGNFTLNGALTLENSGGSQERPLQVNAGESVTINGDIGEGANSRALVLTGGGTMTINGTNNTYSGQTSVGANATMVVNADITSSSDVAVDGTLRGTGTLPGTVVAGGGTIGAGNSIGTLSIGAGNTLTLQDNATIEYEILEAGNADLISGDELVLPDGGSITLTVLGLDGHTISANDEFTVFDGMVTNFDTATISIDNQTNWTQGFEISEGSLVLTAIPEPRAYALLAGLFALGAIMRRRRS